MKKTLQLLCVFCILIFTYSCGSGTSTESDDPGTALAQTWQVSSITAYDNMDCSTGEALFSYGYSGGRNTGSSIEAATAVDCQNLEWFFDVSDDDDSEFVEGTFCNGSDGLNVSMYMHFDSTDSLSEEATGTYIKTMYAKQANGLDHSIDYSTYGRYYTYGTNMTSQILAQIENDNGLGNDRVVEATEDSDDQVNWTYEVSSTSLKMKWMDPTIVAGSCNCDDATDPAACTAAAAADADACELAEGNWITDSNDGTASCVVIDYGVAEDHELRGCTDPLASNYFGGDNNDFGITATKETGKCHYSVDEASQPCVKISHDDFDLDGEYTEDEVVTYNGIIDCAGACQYESLITGWIGDGICDGGTRGDAAFNCEAFDWDGWDCACAPSCLATYDKDTEVSASLSSDDVFNPSQIGEGNNGPGSGSYTNTNCQEACMVEDCGYDMLSTADDVPATYEFWDCCSEACLNSLIASDGSTCSDACNLGECNFYRKGGVSIGGCCDQSGPDGVFGDNANTASIDESVDDIDCSNYDATTNPDGLGADGKCDEECNSGACNNDGGDCE